MIEGTGPRMCVCVFVFVCGSIRCFSSRHKIAGTQACQTRDDDDDVQRHSISNNDTFQESSGHDSMHKRRVQVCERQTVRAPK